MARFYELKGTFTGPVPPNGLVAGAFLFLPVDESEQHKILREGNEALLEVVTESKRIIDELRGKVRALEDSYSKQAANNAQMAEAEIGLRACIATKDKQLEGLVQERDAAEGRCGKHIELCGVLTRELQDSKKLLDLAVQDRDSAERKCGEYRENRDATHNLNDQLRLQKVELERIIESRNASLKGQNDLLNEKATTLLRQNGTISTLTASNRELLEDLEKYKSINKGCQKKIAELVGDLGRVNCDAVDLQDTIARLSGAQAQIKSLDGQIKNLHSQIAKQNTELTELYAQDDLSLIVELRKTVAGKDKELVDVKSDLGAYIDTLRKEVEQKDKFIATANQAVVNLTTKIDKTISEVEQPALRPLNIAEWKKGAPIRYRCGLIPKLVEEKVGGGIVSITPQYGSLNHTSTGYLQYNSTPCAYDLVMAPDEMETFYVKVYDHGCTDGQGPCRYASNAYINRADAGKPKAPGTIAEVRLPKRKQ